MKSFIFKPLLALVLTGLTICSSQAAMVVIGHDNKLAGLDQETISRLYTGKAIEYQGMTVAPVNLVPESPLRARFMEQVVGLDNDKYIAYWVVRRSIGRGIPPKEFPEFPTTEAMQEYIRNTPGAIGYLDEKDVKPGVSILFKK